MILEFGLPEPLVVPAADFIPQGATLVRVRDLHRVEQMLATSSGLLLGMSGPSARLLLSDLEAVRRRHPWITIVVAVPHAGGGLDSRVRLMALQSGADAVVSFHELGCGERQPTMRWPVLPLRRLARVVAQAEHLPQDVRLIMVRAMIRETAYASVAHLAADADRHRASLWKMWGRCERELLSVGRFVDWIQLLHAVVRKNRGRTWASVAEELGVRPTSLARIGSRLLGQPLNSVGEDVRTHAFTEFLRQAAGLDRPEIPSGLSADRPEPSTS